MSFLDQVIALLKLAFEPSVPVYRNFVPEGITKPSIVANEVSNTSSRVLSGDKYGVGTVWRVSAYVSDDADMQALLDILEGLDNTTNDDFQRIFSQYILTEPRQPNQILTRAFYDLTLHE